MKTSQSCVPGPGSWCLYPTFKEWKLYNDMVYSSASLCLYPTFKEWKQNDTILSILLTLKCLYPTFKEWKHASAGVIT